MREILGKLYYGVPQLRALAFLIPPLFWFRREIAEAFIREVLRLEPRTVLEVGFSDGFLTRRISLALPNSKITAIDTSLQGVLRCKKCGLSNVDFVFMDFFDVQGRFDLLVSMHVFVLFDHKKALKKIGETSKTALISLTGVSTFTRLHRPFHRFFTGLDVNTVEPEDYKKIAEDMGFRVEVIKINDIERSYLVRLEI